MPAGYLPYLPDQDFLLPQGRDTRSLNRLLQLKRSYPAQPFLAALGQALKYGMFDLARLETLVLRHVAGDFFCLDNDDQDDTPHDT